MRFDLSVFVANEAADSVQRRILLSSGRGTPSRQHEFPSVENRDEWGSLVRCEIEEIKISQRWPSPQDAGLWIRGNLSHRFRDTAVDFWLGEGASLTEIAATLGDTLAVVERHYADLVSKRMQSRLAKMPLRRWEVVRKHE